MVETSWRGIKEKIKKNLKINTQTIDERVKSERQKLENLIFDQEIVKYFGLETPKNFKWKWQ